MRGKNVARPFDPAAIRILKRTSRSAVVSVGPAPAAAFNPLMIWGITGGLMVLIYLVLVLALAGWSVWRNQKIRQKKAYLQVSEQTLTLVEEEDKK
ncbi:hypothetical protein M3Y99_01255300 [Aphelenchoides fujianensis]|nr:hypothetical protein M3Y99_01255300 [Aphelenchoides fujianensis]